MKDPDLTVVVPAFNEARRIEISLEKIVRYFKSRQTAFEVVVVDDGSTDGTPDLVRSASQKWSFPGCRVGLLENGVNRGKGFSVRRGMLAAGGAWALLCDADLSAPIEEYAELERALGEGCAIAIASRDVAGARVEVHQSALRERSGKLYNVLVRLLFGLPFRDTQCGFKLFDMGPCRRIFTQQRLTGFGFDVELLVIAQSLGYKVREVPVLWRHDKGSKVHFLRDGAKMILDLVRIRWNALRGCYR